ncbi:DUF4241 domain-containing protein [Phytohabitans kaempferiae]|uniref:DUF4241 domain-containing protein n=1 Tax=Phytohabitans kaempferiae TaxID=1620943 RepID=A0ABV6MAT0_9ACTN
MDSGRTAGQPSGGRAGPAAPDFDRLLADGYAHDASYLRPGCVATARVVPGDRLRLPTGRLVAAEPLANGYPFTQTVPPGDYPVEVVLAQYTDQGQPRGAVSFTEVAAARVVVRPEPAHTWRLALHDGQDAADLAEGEIFGYPVDGGTGSFGSVEVFQALVDDDEARDDLIADASFDRDEPSVTYTHEETGTNLVMFTSGGGDGVYPTWVGYTAGGEVTCFLTDFGVLT